MFHWSLSPSASNGLLDVGADLSPGRPVLYVLGSCPIRLRGIPLSGDPAGDDPVLVIVSPEEEAWIDRLADMIDAWNTATRSGDAFWIGAVSERIRRLAAASNGLIEYLTGEEAYGIAAE
jgi:hypothetical protein